MKTSHDKKIFFYFDLEFGIKGRFQYAGFYLKRRTGCFAGSRHRTTIISFKNYQL